MIEQADLDMLRGRGQRRNTDLLVIAQIAITTICRHLRARRRKIGMTQTDLAAALDVDVATISNWENGHRLPTGMNLFAWATHLDVDIGVIPPAPTGEQQ